MRKRSSQRTSNFHKMGWLQMLSQNSQLGNRLKAKRQDKGSGGHLIKLLTEGGIHFNKSDSFARGLECLYLSCFVCSLAFGLLYFLPQDACGLLMENIREQHQDVPHSACCCQQPTCSLLSLFGRCSFYPCLAPGEFQEDETSNEAWHSRPATTNQNCSLVRLSEEKLQFSATSWVSSEEIRSRPYQSSRIALLGNRVARKSAVFTAQMLRNVLQCTVEKDLNKWD